MRTKSKEPSEGLYHFNGKVITRRKGGNTVNRAAYQRRTSLEDKNTGTIHNHSKTTEDTNHEVTSKILFPSELPSEILESIKNLQEEDEDKN